MRKISAYEIALSALSCAIATLMLLIGTYSAVLLFTGYLLACIALMMPLSKQSYWGYALAYIATCLLSLMFGIAHFFDLLPFIMFFGLHPLINELQLKTKIKIGSKIILITAPIMVDNIPTLGNPCALIYPLHPVAIIENGVPQR